MKNFFKKLSFVLAIAMVLTSLAPATASAAAKNYVAVNGKKATATYAYIGGKEVVLTPYVNGKKATKVTIENSNPEKATIDNNGVITPVANGNTIVTFKKGDKKIGTVTVKVRTRAKALNIYDRAEYKAGNKTKLTELTLKVGEKKDLQITMPLYKVSKKAGAVKASYFTYPEVSDSSVVKVTKNAGQRNFTVEALAAGTAKVTIVANQKTEKNVRADKYYKEASFDVTVKDETITAKQSGVNKITVTGADLTDKVADYVVKRGTVTLSIKSVTLNDAKTEAVLQAASSTMPKGDYTVSFNKGEEVAFTVEEGVVAKIVVDPESAILDTDNTKAYTFFKILNQFDEDVTKAEAANCTFTGATQDNTDPYKLNFSNGAQPYTLNLSTVALSIVCNKNGVNYVKVLNVTGAAKLNETEFKGLYKLNATTGKYEVATITVNDDPANFFLLFSAVDQYGRSAVDYASNSLQVNLSSITGLTCATAPAIAVDGVKYLAYKLVGPIANAGDVTILGVQLTDGKTVKGEFTVGQKQLIDSLTVTASSDVYGNQDNALEFTALDQDGKEIKDYATLSRLNSKLSAGLKFVVKTDGSAKLVYTAVSNDTTIATPVVLTWLSETNKFGSVNLSVRPNRVLSAVIGVKSTIALSVTEGGKVEIKPNEFTYQDQYGNIISDSELDKVAANSANKLLVIETASTYDSAVFGTTVTNAGIVVTDSATKVIDVTAGNKAGSLILKASIKDVKASDTTITLVNTSVASAANFEISDIDRVQVATTGAATATASFKVFGTSNGTKVELRAGTDYTVYNNSNVVSAIDVSKEGYKVKEAELVVIINNAAGTTLTKKFEYSNAPAEVKTVAANAMFSGNIHVGTGQAVDAATVAASADPWTSSTAVLNVRDQYNKNCDIAPRVTFSGYSADAKLNHNGTTTSEIEWSTVGFKTVNVKYVWDNGTTFETTLTIDVH